MVKKKSWLSIIKSIILLFIAGSMLVPFYWVVISSFKSNSDIFGHPFRLPTSLSFDSFTKAWINASIGGSMLNSLLYSTVSIIFIMLFSAMVAYILTHVRPNKYLNTYFAFGLLIPIHAVIIPLNIVLRSINVDNTRIGLVIAYVVSNLPLSIFLLIANMRSIPKDLVNAATIDGCNGYQTFWRVILPLSTSGLATVATFAFINCWNDLLLGMVLVTKRELQTVNVAVSNLRASFSDNYNILTAGITCMFVPSVIVYFLFQEQVIKGMTSGAIKG